MRNKIVCGVTSFCCILSISYPSYAAETVTYTYDVLGRLVKVVNTGDANTGKSRSYCYDKAGNRVYFESDTNAPPASCVTQG